MLSGRGWSSSIGSEGADTFDGASPPRLGPGVNINRPKSKGHVSIVYHCWTASDCIQYLGYHTLNILLFT